MYTIAQIQTLSIAKLVAVYNELTGSALKHFRDRATAIARVSAVLPVEPTKKEKGNRRASIAQSWKNEEVRAARCDRPEVMCDGQPFSSIRSMCIALGMSPTARRQFRKDLKAAKFLQIGCHSFQVIEE